MCLESQIAPHVPLNQGCTLLLLDLLDVLEYIEHLLTPPRLLNLNRSLLQEGKLVPFSLHPEPGLYSESFSELIYVALQSVHPQKCLFKAASQELR